MHMPSHRICFTPVIQIMRRAEGPAHEKGLSVAATAPVSRTVPSGPAPIRLANDSTSWQAPDQPAQIVRETANDHGSARNTWAISLRGGHKYAPRGDEPELRMAQPEEARPE